MTSTEQVPNVLFSTTRSWNSGDDFILFGLRNLISEVLPGFNALIYNRNPDLHAVRLKHNRRIEAKVPGSDLTRPVNPFRMVRDTVWKFDNSWRPPETGAVDYVIFAGTPEWFGAMLRPLVKRIVDSDIPVAYVALGAFENTEKLTFSRLPSMDRQLLERARLVTVRDGPTAEILAPLDPVRLPCTALFAAPFQKTRRRGRKFRIALSMQGRAQRNFQRIDPATFDYAVSLYRKLAAVYDCTLVCHYIDEVNELREHLGDVLPFAYSYDAWDYIDIYNGFDLTVTTRVHGAGLCASLGIPAVVLSHSTRSGTAAGFLAELVDCGSTSVDEVMQLIADLPVSRLSRALLKHKKDTRRQYLPLLQEFFRPGE